MVSPPLIVKDATDATAFTMGVGTGIGAVFEVVSVGLAILVGVLSVIALFYSIKLRRRELRKK